MKPFINKVINKTWLGIGVVTVAMLLASSAATSLVVAAPAKPAPSRTAADIGVHRHAGPMRPAMPSAAAPRYYGRPTDYAPAYPPGPFVLFTPFFD